jgi:integrase/recombinase XerD
MPTTSRARKLTVPGTMYVPANCKRIYIKYVDQRTGKYTRVATGLRDTPEGRELAAAMLKKMYLRDVNLRIPGTQGLAPSQLAAKEESGASIDFASAFDKFLASKTLLPKTTASYKDAFHRVIPPELRKQTMDDTVIKDAVQTFLKSPRLRATSINIYLRSFQVFLNFCSSMNWVKAHNYYKTNRQQAGTKRIQIFEEHEIVRIVKHFEKTGRKNLALFIEFMSATGFRVGQALALQWSDIDDKYIYRLSKNKVRNEPFPLTKELQRILQEMPRTKEKPNKVFFWEDSSQSTLARYLSKAMEELGIEKSQRNWHVFRKTAATRWAAAGIPIQEVQKLLGHTQVSVTSKYYVGVEMDTVKEKLERISAEKT